MNTELREELELLSGWDIPKCDVLEFLLEKLPRGYVIFQSNWGLYRPGKLIYDGDAELLICRTFSWEGSGFPVNAASKLLIQLFKEGILSRE